MIAALMSFFAMFALDMVFARYAYALTAQRACAASMWASLIVVCNAVVIINYVADVWTLAPAVVGAFAGTWVAVVTQRRAM